MTIQELLEPYAGKVNDESLFDEVIEMSTTIGGLLYTFDFHKYEDDPWYLLEEGMKLYEDDVSALYRKYTLEQVEDMVVYEFIFNQIDSNGERHTDITNTGNVATVFSATKTIFEQFMGKIQGNVDVFYFTAKEESRAHLYDRLSGMLAKATGWKLETFHDEVKQYLLFNVEHLRSHQ
jgi:hypothetical protein